MCRSVQQSFCAAERIWMKTILPFLSRQVIALDDQCASSSNGLRDPCLVVVCFEPLHSGSDGSGVCVDLGVKRLVSVSGLDPFQMRKTIFDARFKFLSGKLQKVFVGCVVVPVVTERPG